MTAHEYLSLYLALDKDIERWRREIKKCMDITVCDSPFSVTAAYSDMPRGGSGGDRMATFIAKHVDNDMRRVEFLQESIQGAKEKQLKIVSAIDAVPINLARQVLDLRYLQGYSLQEIADQMRPIASVDTVRRRINEGLNWVVFDGMELPDFSQD
jgi:hypothetical protein